MELSPASPTNSHGLQDAENESKQDYVVDYDTPEINHNKLSDMDSVPSSFADPSKPSTNLEYLTSSTEEDENKLSFTKETLANDSSLILNETINVHTVVSCLPNESLGIILGMNERIEFEEGEKREIYVKKIIPNGAVHRVVLESQSFTLGDEILAINGAYFEKMTRSECIEFLRNLPSEVSFISRRNPMPWTAGPRCSFYLNLIDNNRESILSPAPKLFTNEGKKIPDNYKLLEISLYREIGDQLGISLVPSFGDTNHYYQIKSFDPEGLCSKSKLLNQGDCLVSCNGNSLYKIPFNQCLNIINSEGPSLTFEILRKDAIAVDENIKPEANINLETKVNNNNNNNNSDDSDNSSNKWNPEIELENRILKDKTKEFDENEDLLISFKDLSTADSEIAIDLLNDVTADVALLQESTSDSDTEQCPTSQTVSVKSSTEALCLDPIGTLNLSSETQDFTEANLGGSEDRGLTKGIVEDKCIQQDVASEHSSVPNNSADQRNMSEYRNSKQEFSSNGSDDSLISNELNNNINIIYPCYSNEDLISLGLDSPPPHKADLTFQSTIVAPREAAGESKSDLEDIDIDPFLDQQDNYRSQHNLNNFSTNPTGFPIGRHQEIKITNNSNDLLNFQSNNNQKKSPSYHELLEDELESPFSTDGSLPSSFGAQVADEDGDINTHLSLMHSQNDGAEENLVMSPDSGRPDSPRIQKNSSLNSLKISHKRDITSPYSNLSDDFKSEDDSSTVYYDLKTDEDDTTTYQDLSEISTELGDKFQKSNHSDFFESADSCKTSESSFDMCNDGDQETDRPSKPLKSTTMSEVHLKSRDTKSLPRTMTSNYMTESFQDSQLKSLNKYAIDTSLLKNVSENILPTSNPSVNNKEKLFSTKRFFSSTMKQERKNSNKTRSEEKPFRVEVLKGILGLGMTLAPDGNGFVRVLEIKSQSTIGKNGNIKVGDYILSINSTDLVNVTDYQVQQILRFLPRGLITVIASVLPITDWRSHIADADKFGRENSTNQNGIGLTAPVKISSITSMGSLLKVETRDKTVFDKAKTDIDSSNKSLTKDGNFNLFQQSSIGNKSPSALEINVKPSLDKPVHVEKTLSEDLHQITEIKPSNTRNSTDIFGTSSHVVTDRMSSISSGFSSSSSSSSSNFKEDNIKPSNISLTRSEPMKTDFPKIQVEKRALPDILQDHAEPIKRQYISKAQNSVSQNNTTRNQSPMDIQEDVIVPLQNSRIINYSAPPQVSPRKLLRYFPKPGDMDLVDPEEKDKSIWVKTSKNATTPSGIIAKEDIIIPAKAKSVRSLVERYNSPPQKSKELRRVEIKTCNGVTEKIRAVNMKAAQNSSPKPAIVEELVQAVYKHKFASDFKAPKSVSNNTLSMEDVLVIEKTEQLNSKPNVKMTLKTNFSPEKDVVAEPVIEPMQKFGIFARPKPTPRQTLVHNKDNDQSKYQMDDLDVMTVDRTSSKTYRSPDKHPENSMTNVSVIQELLIKPKFVESKLMNKKYGAVNSSSNRNTMNEEAIVPVVKKPRYSTNIQKLAKLLPVSMEDDNTEESKPRSSHSPKQKSSGISYLQEIFEEEKIVPQVKKSRALSQLSMTKTLEKNEETTLGIWQCNTKLPNTESGHLSDDVEFKEFSGEIPENKPVISESILEITQKKPSHSARTSGLDSNNDQSLLEDFDPIEKENVAPVKWNRIDSNLADDSMFVRSSEDLITLDTAIKPEYTLVSHTVPEGFMKIPNAQPFSQKRSLPIIEDGKPKPLPRRSRSPLSESDTSNQEDNFRPKRRTLPTPRGSMTSPNADMLNETLKSTSFEDSSSDLKDHHGIPVPVSPRGTRRIIGSPVRELNPALSPKRRNGENKFFVEPNFNTYGSPTVQKYAVDYIKAEGNTLEQKPEMFITSLPQQYTDIKEVRESSGRHLPKIPVLAESPDSSRSLPSVPLAQEANIEQYNPDVIVEEQKSISRSLPIVPERPALSPFYEEPLEPAFKTAMQTPLVKQTVVSESILQTVKQQDSTSKSVPSSLPNSEIPPFPKLVSVNSSFSEKQPTIIHNAENDSQKSVASSPKRSTSWNSVTSDKQINSSPSSPTKKSDLTLKDVIEEDLCSRVIVTKERHSIRNGRTSPRSLPLVDLSDFSTDGSNEKTSSVLASSVSHVAVEPLKDNHKKESYHSSIVSSDPFGSPPRSLETQSSNIKEIPDKNETKMEWSTNLPATLQPTSPLTPTSSSLISLSPENHAAPIELLQKEELVISHSMPSQFSASKSKETETVSSQMATPAVEPPISPRITSNRKLPDIFKSSRTNAPVVGQITSPSASEILFTDFAPGSPNVSPVIETMVDVQNSKHNFAEVPKAEIASSEPIAMQPKVSKDLPQPLIDTTSTNSFQVAISKNDAVSQKEFQIPSKAAKAETFAEAFTLKTDKKIPVVETRRASLKRETLESVTQVESSRKGIPKTTGDDSKDNSPSKEPKKLTVNISKSPNKSEVTQDTNRSPPSTDGSSVVLRRSRGRAQVSPRSELISDKALLFSSGSNISEGSISKQRRKEVAKTCIDPYVVFTKRKWCISTRFGQTNFALPSEPESSQDVLKLSLLDEDTVIDFVSKANFALDKLGLTNHYSIHICIVEKEPAEKIGIRLQKGEKQELLISLLEPDGAAKRQQYIYEGDLLLYMDGKPAWNQTVMDMKTMLQTIATRIILVLARPFVGEDSETFEIILRKGVTGLGFSLGGGIGCPLGDRPISVKRIFKGGIADKCGEMRVGDEILEVNGEDFRNQRHFHAWNHLKFLPEGDLKLLICRHRSNERMDPLPTRTRTARQGTTSEESAPTTTVTTTMSTTRTTSVEPSDPPPSATPVVPLVPLSPDKASTGIAAAAAMIAMSTVGVQDAHQLQTSTTTTTTNTTITTTTTIQNH